MEQRELCIALREMAREKGLCDEWYGEWKDDDNIDTLLDRFIKGFDFVVKNDFPSLEFCRKNFDKEDLHRHNIYLDDEVAIESYDNGFYIFLGNCKGTLLIKDMAVATIYVRHDSHIDVKATDGSLAFVTYFDNATGNVSGDKFSKFKKYNRNK